MFKGFGFHSLATLDLGCLWQEVGWRPHGTAKIYSFSLNSSRSMTCVSFLWEEKTLKRIYSKAPWKETYFKPGKCVKKPRHHFAVKGLNSHSYSFPSTHVLMWEPDNKEGGAPKNWCFQTLVLGKTLENPWDSKEVKTVSPKGNQPWIFIGISNTMATWCEVLTRWKRPWCWERLRAGGEGDDRGWDGWMAPPTWWTWVWASSGSWWRIGNPGMLQSMELQRIRHYLATEQQQFFR